MSAPFDGGRGRAVARLKRAGRGKLAEQLVAGAATRAVIDQFQEDLVAGGGITVASDADLDALEALTAMPGPRRSDER